MDVSLRWSEVVQRPEPDVDLDEAALLISARANPGLDVAAQLARLDELALRVGEGGTPALCRALFDEMGLRGDRESYDDPSNSYLDRVLDRGRGIPISLSVLMIEIGRRSGIHLEAVGMPGHFLVRDPSVPDELIDAYDGGRRLDRDGCERLMRTSTRSATSLTSEMLATTGTHAVLARMLANLDGAFDRRQDRASLAWVSELRLSLPGAPVGDRLQLGTRLAALGRFDAAATVFEDAAEATAAQSVRERVLREATTLRSRLN